MRYPCPALTAAIMIAGLGLALAGCSGMNRSGTWPSLQTRPGEIAPMVPRFAPGACADCAPDAAPVAAAQPEPPAVPADIAQRLDRIAASITAVERALPAQQRATAAAVSGSAAKRDGEADVQRSRYEALFLPLATADQALDRIDDDLAGTVDIEAFQNRIAALRDRLAKLEAARTAY